MVSFVKCFLNQDLLAKRSSTAGQEASVKIRGHGISVGDENGKESMFAHPLHSSL